MAEWHRRNRATPEGKAKERERNAERYGREAPRRRAYAIDYYYEDQATSLARARRYRENNPHRRRSQRDRRSARMRTNPGFCPFGRSDWLKLVRRHDGRCFYCGSREALVMDHVVPLARGGRHAIANILPACPKCNGHKNDLLLSEWKRRPTYPERG